MLTAISYKSKQFSLVLIKIGIVVSAFYLIYNKLFQNSDFHFADLLIILTKFSAISFDAVLFLMVLSCFNWFLEILKWRHLVTAITKITFKKAKSQTLGAFTASLITPNRIGEYGAKALYYHPSLRKEIMLLNLLGNTAQMAATTIFGGIGMIYFSLHFNPEFNYDKIILWFSAIILGSVLLWFIVTSTMFGKYKKSLKKLIKFIKTIPKEITVKTVMYSAFRYLVFSHQFYIILLMFDINTPYSHAMAAISTMYLLSSIIPSIFIFDVVIKGGIAIYIFGLLGISQPIVFAIVTLMWVLNVVLPSIIGSYYVLQFKLPKTET